MHLLRPRVSGGGGAVALVMFGRILVLCAQTGRASRAPATLLDLRVKYV